MPDGFLTAVAVLINALFLAAGFYIYLALSRQIASRASASAEDERTTFGVPDGILALALATLFSVNAAASDPRADKLVLGTNDLIANALVSVALFVFIAAFPATCDKRL